MSRGRHDWRRRKLVKPEAPPLSIE